MIMSFQTLALIHLLACITPGPALMYALDVLAKTNLRNAVKVVLGITIGNAFEVILSILGISVLANIAREHPAFFYLSCAALLFYLGGKGLVGVFRNVGNPKQISSNKYIMTGLTITIFNPKALIFWGFFLSPVVVNYSVELKILTAIYFISMTFILLCSDVYLFSIFKEKMMKYLQIVQGVLGILMIAFAFLMSFKAYTSFLHS